MEKQPKQKQLERGSVISQIGSILIVAFIFALILAYSAYGKITQERLAINNVAKEYLYKMEEMGFLSSEDQVNLDLDMANIGATIVSYTTSDGSITDTSQVTYGDRVTLALAISFQNPLYRVFSTDEAMFQIHGFEENLNYELVMSSTAKW